MYKCVILAVLVVLTMGAAAQGENETIYFLVTDKWEPFPSECYVLPLDDPSDIAHARALLAWPRPTAQIVVAHIDRWDPNNGININRNCLVPGAPAWSWYVTEFEGFAEYAAEVCDGWPGWVEEDPYWGNVICFWSYTVYGELGTDLQPWSCDLDAAGWYMFREVVLNDLALFASRWLESGCGHREYCGGADLDGSGMVDMKDFAIFAESWQWQWVWPGFD